MKKINHSKQIAFLCVFLLQGCDPTNIKKVETEHNQPSTPNPVTQGKTEKPSYADSCGIIPYSIQLKDAGGEVSISLLSGALEKGLDGTVGAGMVKTAYSGMVQQAINKVAGYYECLLEKEIKANVPDDKKNEYRESVRKGILEIRLQFPKYATAFANNAFERQDALEADIRKKNTRSFPGIDLKVFDAATAWVNLDKTFGEETRWEAWAKAKGFQGIDFGACGGFLLAALEDNTGPIQIAVMDTRSIMRDMLDDTSPTSERSALSKMFLQASTSSTLSIPPIPKDLSSSFKGCSDKLKQQITEYKKTTSSSTETQPAAKVVSPEPIIPSSTKTPTDPAISGSQKVP